MKLSEENQKKLEALTKKYEGKISAAEIRASAISYFQEHATLSGFDIENIIQEKKQAEKKENSHPPLLFAEWAEIEKEVCIHRKNNHTHKQKQSSQSAQLPQRKDYTKILYINEKEDEAPLLRFKLTFEPKYTATNTLDGSMHEAPTAYELFKKNHDKMVAPDKNGKIRNADNNYGSMLVLRTERPESIRQDWARSAIEHNLILLGECYPKDKKFWQSFKAEYLKDKNHSAENWEKLTADIPDEIMGRNKISDKEKLNTLSRQGINLNSATPTKQNTAQSKLNVNQITKQTRERQ